MSDFSFILFSFSSGFGEAKITALFPLLGGYADNLPGNFRPKFALITPFSDAPGVKRTFFTIGTYIEGKARSSYGKKSFFYMRS